MKGYFELNDKGTCNRFTLVRGIRKTHQFIKNGDNGASRLEFDLPEDQYVELMRDILGVEPSFFQSRRPIFVFIDRSDVKALEDQISHMTEAANAHQEIVGAHTDKVAALEKKLAESDELAAKLEKDLADERAKHAPSTGPFKSSIAPAAAKPASKAQAKKAAKAEHKQVAKNSKSAVAAKSKRAA